MIQDKRLSFRGIYFIGLAATAIGIGVVILLNLATLMEYMHGRLPDPDLEWYQKLHHILNLAFLLLLSCPLLPLFMRHFLRSLSKYFNLLRAGRETDAFMKKARQRAINLPFILIPFILGLWILLPTTLYFAAYVTGNIDWRTAIILAIRAIMVGFISVGIMSLWIESYVRRRFIPLLFPQGRLTETKGVARYSISRRIRLHNRLGSLYHLIWPRKFSKTFFPTKAPKLKGLISQGKVFIAMKPVADGLPWEMLKKWKQNHARTKIRY